MYQIPGNSNDKFRIFFMKEVGLYMFTTHIFDPTTENNKVMALEQW
jgi:hypothetical protein